MNCIVLASCNNDIYEEFDHTEPGEGIVGSDCWTQWINSDDPKSGHGDFEIFNVLQKKYSFCLNPIGVQCRDALTKKDAIDSNQDVTCDKDKGLSCWNNRTQCNDYEIRFFCPCPGVTTFHETEMTSTVAPESCQTGWSPWYNSHIVDKNGDYDSLQLVEESIGRKFCFNGTVNSVKCQTKHDSLSHHLSEEYVICDMQTGLLCENSKQDKSKKCHDYEISFHCDCLEQTLTQEGRTFSVSPTFPPNAIGGSDKGAQSPYTTPVPTVVPGCSEFVPLINGDEPLPDTNLKESSKKSSDYSAKNIRISNTTRKRSGRAWIPSTHNKNQYVEIDLSIPRLIYGIITQGREDYEEWVTSYYILYSHDGYLFVRYEDPHSSQQVIPGNYDSRSLVKVILDAPFEARFVRIQPNTWEGQIALRAEVLGCSDTAYITDEGGHIGKDYICLEPMGLENGLLSDEQMTASSIHDWSHTPFNGRIGGSGWVAGISDDKQYFQVDFLDPRNISAIVTQGREKENQWVSAYLVSYSNDGKTWAAISSEQDRRKLKIFPGNYDGKNLVTNYLPHTLRTRYLRIMPLKWKNWISLKLEILGCFHPYREIITTTVGEQIYALPKEKVTVPTGCLQPMGLSFPALSHEDALPDDLISVSSSITGAGPSRLRLNSKAQGGKKGGWIPKPSDKNPFVLIDFLISSTLTSITTKGIEGTSRWIESYKISVSNDTDTWQPVYSDKSDIFEGNIDDKRERNNMFDTPVIGRYLKLEVIRTENYHPGLRMEIFGCRHAYETLPTTPLPSLSLEERCVKFGQWQSLSDPNLPNSKGDFENIKDIIFASDLCTNPITIECRTYGTHTDYKKTGQYVTCDLTKGLSCRNKDQKQGGRCYNYEARIKCWTCPMESNETNELPGLLLCPELPRHMAKRCPSICPNKLLCNGTSCVDKTECPCVHGNKVFSVGHKTITENCEECQCTLGGHSMCFKKSCDPCLPEQRPILLPDCSCSCESCKERERMCSTNDVCISEEQWCDGIEDCPDDENDCSSIFLTTPEASMPPAPENGTCELLGKRIRTFDGQELDYEICDHVVFLDAIYDNFNVTVKKKCLPDSTICHTIYVIQQDETSVQIDNDVQVSINGNNYTASQLTLFNKRNSNITVEIVGNHVRVKSKVYGFTVIRDQRANLKVEMPSVMKNRVIGLCGLYNDKIFDDKKKPDGIIAVTSKEFGDSWTSKDAKHCTNSNCTSEIAEKALDICKKLREDPFDICQDYLNVETYVQACVSSTCDCLMENINKVSECKCAAFLPLLEACQNKIHHPLSKWRTKHHCAPHCEPGFIWEDCGTGCPLTCDNANLQAQSCLETCIPGCFCPAGTVLDGNKCISPEECSNAVCQGFGDPHFTTFDELYYPFQALGNFVFATDINSTFSIEGMSGKCSTVGNGTCLSALTVTYRNNKVIIKKGKPIIIGDKFVTMEMLPVETNGITILGFPGHVYIVIIPALSITVRYYEMNDAFSISIPPERFFNRTRGLCGNCNQKKYDEMIPAYGMIINSTGDFVCSWVIGETFAKCKTSFHEKSLENIDYKDQCPEILDFESCLPLVDPTLYQKSCNYDVSHSADRHKAVCDTLMEYSRKCCEAGVVLTQWYKKYNCDIPCPNGTVYHHCHDVCTQTCQNNAETINCHDFKVDACFCPENKVLKDGVCIDEIYCKLPTECTYTMKYEINADGKEVPISLDMQKPSSYKVGEKWQDGLCQNCICQQADGQYVPYCTVTECPDHKTISENVDYNIVPLFRPWMCCPRLMQSQCKDEDGNLMEVGKIWQNKTDPCKEFECRRSSNLDASKIMKEIKCGCNGGEEEQPKSDNQCCGKCIKKQCFYNNKTYSVGDQWSISKCYIGECEQADGQLFEAVRKNCSQMPDSCPKEDIIRDENNCCDVCNVTLGKIGCNTVSMDLKVGDLEKESKDHGKCINDEPLSSMLKCAGTCESESMYSLKNGEVASSCQCCNPVTIEVTEIELKCEDGTREKFKLEHPKACTCSPCAASAKYKGKNNRPLTQQNKDSGVKNGRQSQYENNVGNENDYQSV